MCRHIYDWNIVNCDVKQPIQLSTPYYTQVPGEGALTIDIVCDKQYHPVDPWAKYGHFSYLTSVSVTFAMRLKLFEFKDRN